MRVIGMHKHKITRAISNKGGNLKMIQIQNLSIKDLIVTNILKTITKI